MRRTVATSLAGHVRHSFTLVLTLATAYINGSALKKNVQADSFADIQPDAGLLLAASALDDYSWNCTGNLWRQFEYDFTRHFRVKNFDLFLRLVNVWSPVPLLIKATVKKSEYSFLRLDDRRISLRSKVHVDIARLFI